MLDGVDLLHNVTTGDCKSSCYRPTCINSRGAKWQNIDRISAQGDSEKMSHVTTTRDFGIQLCEE